MFRKLGLVFSWFLLVPIMLISLSVYLTSQNNNPIIKTSDNSSSLLANDTTINNIEGYVLGIEINDTRPFIVENFLKNTPLEPYSNYLVEAADRYSLDYRLIPAIAMKETGGGIKAPQDSYNAWGFENGRTIFVSWENAIESVAKTLKEKYADRGLITPEQIMPIYAPPQIYTGGKWAKDINFFFSEMESL